MISGLMMRRLMAPAALVAGLSAALAAHAADKALDPLSISYPPSNAVHWNLDVALDKGFFRDEGFAAAPTSFQSSPQAVQLLVTNAVQVATVEPESMIAAAARGGTDLAAIDQPNFRPDWFLVVRADIKSWSDLKGKTLGFSGLRIAEYYLTERLSQAQGLAKGDWNAIQVGTSPAKLAALRNGSIAGAVLFQPLGREAVAGGLKELSDFTALGNFTPTLLLVNRSWAAQNQNGLRLGRALRRAHAWLYDPRNHDEALTIVEKYTKAGPAIAQQVYQSYFVTDKIYTPDGAVDLAGLDRVIALYVEAGDIAKDKAPRAAQLVLPEADGGLSR